VTSGLERLNALPREKAEERLLACCGSREWAKRVAAARPFPSGEELTDTADRVWRGLSKADWLDAFAAHPKIGSTAAAGHGKARAWSRDEQRGVGGASRAPDRRGRRPAGARRRRPDGCSASRG
jgi:2-oxo-4-hydroxy-4-carboxy--5-ureidoimidazoline (OHCU) decarboxylase